MSGAKAEVSSMLEALPEDMESIASYIERDSPWYAKAVASRILFQSFT